MNERIHIICVGRDPSERLYLPVKALKAHKVYLITKSGKDMFDTTFQEIKKLLLNDVVQRTQNIIEKKVDYNNLYEFMELIAKIYATESEKGNEIYFNISGGTWITVVGIISYMLFGVKPYFAQKNYETDIISKDPTIPDIPFLPLKIPDYKLIKVLNLILKKNNNGVLTKGDLISLLSEHHFDIDFNGEKRSKDYNRLNIRYLSPLSRLKLIEFNYKREIEITKLGKFFAKIFGAYYIREE